MMIFGYQVSIYLMVILESRYHCSKWYSITCSLPYTLSTNWTAILRGQNLLFWLGHVNCYLFSLSCSSLWLTNTNIVKEKEEDCSFMIEEMLENELDLGQDDVSNEPINWPNTKDFNIVVDKVKTTTNEKLTFSRVNHPKFSIYCLHRSNYPLFNLLLEFFTTTWLQMIITQENFTTIYNSIMQLLLWL